MSEYSKVVLDECDRCGGEGCDDWYMKKENELYEIDNEISRGITLLMGRETDSGWEYAIVYWHYGSAMILCQFKHGKVDVREGCGE